MIMTNIGCQEAVETHTASTSIDMRPRVQLPAPYLKRGPTQCGEDQKSKDTAAIRRRTELEGHFRRRRPYGHEREAHAGRANNPTVHASQQD